MNFSKISTPKFIKRPCRVRQTPSKFSNKKPIKAKDESVIFSKRTEIEPKSIFISHKMQKQTVTLPLEIKSIS